MSGVIMKRKSRRGINLLLNVETKSQRKSSEEKPQEMFVAIKQEQPFIGIEGRTRRIPVHLYNVLCIMTFGGFYMLCRYLPTIKYFLLSSSCGLSDADCVIITSPHGKKEFIDIIRCDSVSIPSLKRYTQKGQVRVIDSQSSRLIYDVIAERFVVPPEQKPLSKDFDEFYSGEVFKSPEVERMESIQRDIFYGKNITNLPIPGITDILVRNIFSITFLSNVVCVLVWRAIDYTKYAVVMGVLMTYSFIFTNWEEILHSINMRKLISKQMVKILRNGRFVQVDSREIYPGNVICIELGKEFPCDAIVIKGDAITNECLLTGEAVSIYKSADKPSIIYAGTDVLKSINTNPISTNIRIGNLCRVRNLTRRDKPKTVEMVGSVDDLENLAIGLVLKTGFQTARGQILKNIMNSKPVRNRFIREAELIIWGMVLIALAVSVVMGYVFHSMGLDSDTNMIYSLDLFFTLANPALPTYLRLGTQLCYKKLMKKNIHCNSLNKIHLAGRIDTAVFDKTGTLTCEGLDLLCVDNFTSVMDDIDDVDMITRIGLSTCHMVYELDGKYSGDTLDLKMFIFSSSKLVLHHNNTRSVVVGGRNKIYGPILKEYNDDEEMVYYQESVINQNEFVIGSDGVDLGSSVILDVERGCDKRGYDEGFKSDEVWRSDKEVNATIVKTYEFDSVIRRMSVIADDGLKKYVFTKGSPESIRSILRILPKDYEEKLRRYSLDGYRVISLAYKEISESIDRVVDESDMEFLTLIVFSNKLKPDSRRTIEELNGANIRSMMCTGDNILTAISVGKECGMVGKFTPVIFPSLEDNAKSVLDVDWLCAGDEEEFIFDKAKLSLYRGNDRMSNNDFVVACEGREFDFFRNTQYLEFILEKGVIFARFNPEQKKTLIENLRANGRVTLFCGDGANDSGALSSADVGLALAQNEASLAANFTSAEIGSVVDLIKEGRSAFVTSVATFKYVISSCAIAYMALLFLVLRKNFLSDLQTIHGDLFVAIPVAYLLTCFDSSAKLHSNRPNTFLLTRRDFIPLCTAVTLEGIVIGFLSGHGEASREINDQSVPAELVFFTTVFIYIFNGMYLSDCSPHRQGVKDNRTFQVFIVLMIVMNMIFMITAYLHPGLIGGWLSEYKFVKIDAYELGLTLMSIFFVGVVVFIIQPLMFNTFRKSKRKSEDEG